MIKVVDFSGQEKGSKDELKFLKDFKVKSHIIWEVVTAELSNLRQGTHKTKTRSFVRGGGKKPWRQKGTGHARSGSNRSPVWVGGGTIFGPLPRDYRKKITRKKKNAGYLNILADKVQKDQIIILDEIKLENLKTSEAFIGIKKVLSVAPFAESLSANRKIRDCSNENRRRVTLIVKDESSKKAFRNIPWIQFISVNRLSARYLHYNHGIVITNEAYEDLVKKVRVEKGVI